MHSFFFNVTSTSYFLNIKIEEGDKGRDSVVVEGLDGGSGRDEGVDLGKVSVI